MSQEKQSLKQFLESRGLYFNDKIIKIIEHELNNKNFKGIRAFLLTGPPGTGKTSLAEAIADYLGANKIFYQATLNTSEDDLLYKYLPSEKTKSGIKISLGPLPRAVQSSQKGKTVLIIDEFDKTRSSTDSMFLDFLQNGRLSLYLNNKNSVIKANPDNLIVFITSNNNRELSEPLARRVIRIDFKSLPPKMIYKLMLDKFHDERLALLLTQIYDDTLKAGLQKPATVQELYQLGNAIKRFEEEKENYDLKDLLRMYVLKYPEDEEKFFQYISTREPYQFLNETQENKSEENIINSYIPQKEITQQEEQQEENMQQQEQQPSILQAIESKIKIGGKKKLEEAVNQLNNNQEEVKEELEVSGKVEGTPENYSNIAKHYFEKTNELPETPEKLYNFELMKDVDNKPYLVAQKPFRLNDEVWLKAPGEYYIEDNNIIIPYYRLKELIENCTVYPFSKKITQIINNQGEDLDERINLENIKSFELRGKKFFLAKNLRAYLKCNPEVVSYSQIKLQKLSEIYTRLGLEDLVLSIAEALFKDNDIEAVERLLNDEDIANLKIPFDLVVTIYEYYDEYNKKEIEVRSSSFPSEFKIEVQLPLPYKPEEDFYKKYLLDLYNFKGYTLGQLIDMFMTAYEEYKKALEEGNKEKKKELLPA